MWFFYASVNNALFFGIDVEVKLEQTDHVDRQQEAGLEEKSWHQLKSKASNQQLPKGHESVKLEHIVVITSLL